MSCPGIPELAYSEFGELLKQRIGGKRFPLSGSLEMTLQCNLRCKHCYLDGVHDGIPGEVELSTEEWYGILDQLAEAGTLWLLMTGGEPFVRPDFLDIYTYAKRKGFLITIFTNGTMITPEVADTLAQMPPLSIEISVYGRTRETYERVTGIPGSHGRCMRGIELLLERGLPLSLKTVVMTLNKDELFDLKAWADELGVDFRFDAALFGGMGDAEPTKYRLSPEEVLEIEEAYPGFFEELAEVYRRLLPKAESANRDRLYVCGAGSQSFAIDPTGKLNVCLLSRHPEYNLRIGGFVEGWSEALPAERNRMPSPSYACRDCQLMSICSPCPGKNELETGDVERAGDFRCALAHRRRRAIGQLTAVST